jgi:hypothetical protein
MVRATEMSLGEALGDGQFGYFMGFEGGYRDSDFGDNWINAKKFVITKAPKMAMGVFKLVGVAFGTLCDNPGRHGLEGILWWYYNNRVSNTFSRKPHSISVNLGETVFPKAYVIGCNFAAQDPMLNLWRWEIDLYVTPDYQPKPPQL